MALSLLTRRLVNFHFFAVINKQDTVSAEEQKVALAFVAERLERFAFSEVPRILSISARQGLHAKQSGNANELEDGGLGPLEAELLRFLTEDRAQSFLSNMYGRVSTFLTQQLRQDDQAADRGTFNLLAERLRMGRCVYMRAILTVSSNCG